jgi:hypothetical protein
VLTHLKIKNNSIQGQTSVLAPLLSNWYNKSAAKKSKQVLSTQEIKEIGKFFIMSEVKVANSQRLEMAVCEKEDKAADTHHQKKSPKNHHLSEATTTPTKL